MTKHKITLSMGADDKNRRNRRNTCLIRIHCILFPNIFQIARYLVRFPVFRLFIENHKIKKT